MRLGNNMFYTIERSRQEYLQAVESHPAMALIASFVFFIGFAIRVPVHRNLVREAFYSLGLGFGTTYTYPYLKYQNYLSVIDECYDIATGEFKKRPGLIEQINDDQNPAVLKNFGLSQSNEKDIEDDTDGTTVNTMSVFDRGSEEEMAAERKNSIISRIYGSS